MKKLVLQLGTSNEKIQKKATMKVSGLLGIEEIDLNVEKGQLTVKGDIDAVKVMDMVKKICHARIVSLGAVKEKEKDPDPNHDYVDWFIRTHGYHPATTYYPPPPPYYGHPLQTIYYPPPPAYGGSWF